MIKLKQGENEIEIRQAVPDDAATLADMYQSISVTKYNAEASLNAETGAFRKKGGMFEIYDEGEIRQRIEDPNEKTILGICDGKICGMLWFGATTKETFAALIPNEAHVSEKAFVSEHLGTQTLGYAKEIISRYESPHIVPMALFCAMMNDYLENGTDHAIGEVFRIESYENDTGNHLSGLINGASYTFLTDTGGVDIGETPTKLVELEDLKVWITPHVFLWKNQESIRIIRKYINSKGWEIV